MKVLELLAMVSEENLETPYDYEVALETKSYVGIMKRKAVYEAIISKCVTVEDGVAHVDTVLKKVLFALGEIGLYTTLEFDEDMYVDEYDTLCEIDALDTIIDGFSYAYYEDADIFEEMLGQYIREHSLEANLQEAVSFIKGASEEIMDMIPKDFDFKQFLKFMKKEK